jgi:hypothetical protein
MYAFTATGAAEAAASRGGFGGHAACLRRKRLEPGSGSDE